MTAAAAAAALPFWPAVLVIQQQRSATPPSAVRWPRGFPWESAERGVPARHRTPVRACCQRCQHRIGRLSRPRQARRVGQQLRLAPTLQNSTPRRPGASSCHCSQWTWCAACQPWSAQSQTLP